MNETTRTILIAIGVALLVVILVPLLVMAGMMGAMMGGMSGMMEGWGAWVVIGVIPLVLVAGIALIAVGVFRRR